MDIEKRVWQYLHDYEYGRVELNEKSLAALIREAVAEAVAENDREWQKTYDEAVNNPPGYLIKVVDASKEVSGG